MSKDITKKQHYVWRHYLSAWKCAKDDKFIWTGMLVQKQVKQLGLMDVAQSSYFYKLEELNSQELAFLKQFTNSMPPGSKSIAELLLAGYISFSELKKDMDSGKVKTDQEFEHQVRKVENDTFESIQGKIEIMGRNLLECHSSTDLEELAKEAEYDVLFYIWVQYMRTKSMKDRVIDSMGDRKWIQEMSKKCWPFINLVMAMRMVEEMVVRKDHRFIFMKNDSETPFITGDQPAINPLGNVTDENGYAKELAIFYPTSPRSALYIAFDKGEKFSEKTVDSEFAKSMNQMILDESQLFVFANDEQILKVLIGVA